MSWKKRLMICLTHAGDLHRISEALQRLETQMATTQEAVDQVTADIADLSAAVDQLTTLAVSTDSKLDALVAGGVGATAAQLAAFSASVKADTQKALDAIATMNASNAPPA